MLLGHENVRQYRGGIREWTAQGRYLVIETPEVAASLIGEGALLLDVRDAASFDASHLPGALGVPAGDLEGSLPEVVTGIDTSRLVIVYDEGGEDTRSILAARMLEGAGFAAVRRYAGGYVEWARSGLPVE